MNKLNSLAKSLLCTATFALSAPAFAADITVAYFPEWPMPFQYAQANDLYKDAGLNIKWVSFDAGTAMAAAMASGDVQIAISMGVTPFLNAVSAGQDLQAIDVAVSYSDNQNCVVRKELEITGANAKELEGKEVAIPLGTAAETDFRAIMAHFGVNTDSMKIVDMAPVDSAAAFANGNLDMVCGWGGPLRRMKEHGNTLIDGDEKEAVIGKIYDVTSVVGSWGKENAETVAKFLKVNADMNAKFNNGGQAEMMPDIAKQAGMDMDGATAVINIMKFLPTDVQLSEGWMNGFMVGNFKASADKTAEAGNTKALDSYEGAVNASYLEAASKM